jgi:hypothetical protein
MASYLLKWVFAPSTFRRCSIQWPSLLPLADGAAPCDGPACSLRCLCLPTLLPAAAWLAPSACRCCSLRWPILLPPPASAASYGGRLAPSACRWCSLRWLGLLPLPAGGASCGGPACSLWQLNSGGRRCCRRWSGMLPAMGGGATRQRRWCYKRVVGFVVGFGPCPASRSWAAPDGAAAISSEVSRFWILVRSRALVSLLGIFSRGQKRGAQVHMGWFPF